MFTPTFKVSIYHVDANTNTNKYHLVVENTLDDRNKEFVCSASSQEELYQKAFETVDKIRKSNLITYISEKQKKLLEQEQLSLGVGKGYRKLGNQERATYYFSRANDFFKQRVELEKEFGALKGSKGSNIMPQTNFVSPVNISC